MGNYDGFFSTEMGDKEKSAENGSVIFARAASGREFRD